MCLSEDIKRVSLLEGPKYWAKLINCSEVNTRCKRENSYLRVSEAGYEISTEAKKLELFYMKELGVKNDT